MTYRTAAEAATLVRACLKKAQRHGTLPTDLTFSVTSNGSTGHRAVEVQVRGRTDDWAYPADDKGVRRISGEGHSLLTEITLVARTFTQGTGVLLTVTYESDEDRAIRASQASQRKASRTPR